MKGFDNKFTYFAFSLPSPYVLVGPCGILLFSVRSDKGKVIASGEKWKEPFSIGRIFTIFAREGVGNPMQDLEDNREKIQGLLAGADESVRELFQEIPIDGAAVFLNSDVQLETDSPAIPALRADQVKEYVRRKVRDRTIRRKDDVIDRLGGMVGC